MIILDYNKHYRESKAQGRKLGLGMNLEFLKMKRWIMISAVIIIIYAFFSFIVYTRGSSAVIDNGLYALEYKGEITYVGYETYREVLMASGRSSSGWLMMFIYITFCYFYSREKSLTTDSHGSL